MKEGEGKRDALEFIGSHGEPGLALRGTSIFLSFSFFLRLPAPFIGNPFIFIETRNFTSSVTRRETSRDEIASASNTHRRADRHVIMRKRYTQYV